MNKDGCIKEKNSSRVIGFVILPFGLILAFASFFFLPIFGLIFSLPIVLFAGLLIAAPESKVCKLLTERKA